MHAKRSTPPATSPPGRLRRLTRSLRAWFDAGRLGAAPEASESQRVEWVRILPFVVLHGGCLGVLWVGWSPVALGVAGGLYLLRMFALTAFYHRYFSHRAFKTSRPLQFVFALLGNSAVQRGPLWWAAHHRKHHRHADEPQDVHSPHVHSFLWSHMGWVTSRANFATDAKQVPDLVKFPELRFLDRFNVIVPLLLLGGLFLLGDVLARTSPGLGTSGWQMVVWGFFISTTVLFHVSVSINSLAHRVGSRRYATRDHSRNNWWLAVLTLGEGWHNNHHHYPAAMRQGHRWWEIDPTAYLLRAMAFVGLIWDLKPVPERILSQQTRA